VGARFVTGRFKPTLHLQCYRAMKRCKYKLKKRQFNPIQFLTPYFCKIQLNIRKEEISWPESARTISTERQSIVSEVSANFCSYIEECRVVRAADPYGSILGYLDRNRYFFFQVAPQLYSRGWVDPVPDPLLLRKSGSTANRTRTSGSVVKNYDH
jgi:hypothetical protein